LPIFSVRPNLLEGIVDHANQVFKWDSFAPFQAERALSSHAGSPDQPNEIGFVQALVADQVFVHGAVPSKVQMAVILSHLRG
jgi:hypothetical protein